MDKELKEYNSWSELVLDQEVTVGDLPAAILAILNSPLPQETPSLSGVLTAISEKTSRKAKKKARKEKEREEKLNKKLRLLEYVEKVQDEKGRERCRKRHELWERWVLAFRNTQPVVVGGGCGGGTPVKKPEVKRPPLPPVCKYCGQRHT